MDKDNHIAMNYLLPIGATIFIAVTGVIFDKLLKVTSYESYILAGVLFIVIGISIFLAEIYKVKVAKKDKNAIYTKMYFNIFKRDENNNSVIKVLDVNDILNIENNAEEVWVYAAALEWEMKDNPITDIVHKNIKDGTRYKYLVPNNQRVKTRVNVLMKRYNETNKNHLCEFKLQERELDLAAFAVVIYNPTIHKTNYSDNTIVAFFPNFKSIDNETSNIILSISGSQTKDIEEDFIELWENT